MEAREKIGAGIDDPVLHTERNDTTAGWLLDLTAFAPPYRDCDQCSAHLRGCQIKFTTADRLPVSGIRTQPVCVCVCVQTCKGQLHQATIRTRNRLRSRHCSFAKGEQNRMVSWLLQIWPKCLVRVLALSLLSWRNILTSHRRRLKRQRMAERVDKCIWRITPSPERQPPKIANGRTSEDE